MKITNKTEIMENFKNKKYAKPSFPKDMLEDEPIYMRGEISKIYHFNYVYKDGKKYYLENPVDAIFRLAKRCKVEIDDYTYEELEYCLYQSGDDMKKAKRLFQSRYQ